MTGNNDTAEIILQQLELPGGENAKDRLQQQLTVYINHLINTDFEKLVQLLYRIDIDETKLKNMLEQNRDRDAGEMIAALMIERQLQKLKSRNEFRDNANNIDDDEKW